MAQQSMPNNADNNGGGQHHHHHQQQQQPKHENQLLLAKPIFHDFFGAKPNDSSAVGFGPKAAEPSPSASASASASFGASSAGGRGPISTTSDLASERRGGNHLEGVPFYGARSDISGPEISNKIVGSKRSNSDTTFMGPSRDGIPQMGPDSLEGSQLLKLLRNGAGGERIRRFNEEEVVFGSQQIRPTSASLIFQPPSGVSKLDRSIPMNAGPTVQYPPRGGHFVPFVAQVPSNRFRDANASPTNISQSAADEGSRTGIKGPGILSSINAGGGSSERNVSGALPSGSRQKGVTIISEPESSNPSSRHGFAGSRQMTIFYGGQAHVFDDVHPNKADVIVALAGSNGGSWSTTFSPKSTVKLAGETHVPGGEVETGNANNMALLREYRGRLSIPGSSNQGVGFGDRMPTPTGGHQVSTATTSMRNSVQAAEPTSKEKSEL
ncbi:protein TIFY 8 [Morus notabilis]|uniref:protein TIFY 8 n=1 Tax=Morus notabilis TaxID=981085 RepID=UPI000CED14CD|nr:protein TIFY 8 [Morus notabilis]